MKIREAKILAREGALLSATAVRSPTQDGWHLIITTRSGSRHVLQRYRGDHRVIHKLDAFEKIVAELGFDGFFVDFNPMQRLSDT